TLSIPPTPGRSIVKRPNNHNLSSVGFVFKEKGYDNKFIYGGHGYFDNMNDFFSHNGFNIVDRNDFAREEVSFDNVWGVCDTDLFDKALKEADRSFADKKPFFSFVMTTSNHRPFTFPRDQMSQPELKGRDSGVNYTDYAIDKLLKDAADKPWFDNTIFIIVADHNGGSSGEVEVPLFRYLIPAFIYAPKIIEPKTVSKLSSQVDLMPTVMSLMNWDYKGKFYGNDILSDDFQEQAFVGNYQKLGFYRDNRLTILSPDESVKSFKIESLTLDDVKYEESDINQSDVDDAVTYYQSASYLYKNDLTRYKEAK
ncbi:MAG: LTA synthase family protein, partial [Thiovulaceae bacterium]|nr:LTA synthase family protein [Sulfurimonadaceae bacterium]